MSTRTGDDAATIGNIEDFLQQCGKDLEPDHGPTGPGQLAGVFDVPRQQWRTVRFQPNPHQNEKVLARALGTDLPARTLVVADRGYCGCAWFD